MLGRRQFLLRLVGGIAATAVGAQLDLEKLLWIPNERTIFVPSLTEFGTTDLHWMTEELARLFKKNLTFARVVNREYDLWHEPMLVGQTVGIRLPPRFAPTDRLLPTFVDPVQPVVLSNHFSVEASRALATEDRRQIRKRLLEPAADALADRARRHNLDVFAPLPMPQPSVHALQAIVLTDPQAGISLRAMQHGGLFGDETLRFDILGGSTNPPKRTVTRRDLLAGLRRP
jgi:hypothetical protein